MVASHTGRGSPSIVNAYPIDVSPYNVRGMGGNIREWCLDDYTHPLSHEALLNAAEIRPPSDSSPDIRSIRGGHWHGPDVMSRTANHGGQDSTNRCTAFAFRRPSQPVGQACFTRHHRDINRHSHRVTNAAWSSSPATTGEFMSSLVDPSLAPLFSPVQLGAFSLPNRVLMAPLTRSRANEHTAPHDLHIEYYRQRATAGLIVSEGSQISQEGVGYIRTPGIYSPEQVAGWREVTTAVHAAGGRIACQLWHVGRISHTDLQPNGQAPVAPSAIASPGNAFTPEGLKPLSTPRALSVDDIARVIGDWKHAARCALEAGFDGVQIHGANGYIIDQFLRDGANQRTDKYGGSPENRARFLREVTDAVVGVWGADRVSVRLSPQNGAFNRMEDSDPATTFRAAVSAINGLGLAYLEGVEMGGPAENSLHPMLRETFDGPYVANGAFTAELGAAWIRDGKADAISFGQAFISNPDLPERFRQGAPLAEPNRDTYYSGDASGYTDYPALT
jgi:N-ethylmaleimide reductase